MEIESSIGRSLFGGRYSGRHGTCILMVSVLEGLAKCWYVLWGEVGIECISKSATM